MALSAFQRDLCRLLASTRPPIEGTYVAGGVALNETLAAPRLSRDVDMFHDTLEALNRSWDADRKTLELNGYSVHILRERAGFVEVVATKNGESVEVQWVRDSAYRFFPLIPHADFGFTLHPFDLATNKILALVGRVEIRDWVDALTCQQKVSPLGLLAWAACGKDEGWNPQLIVDEANRNSRYSRDEMLELQWQGEAPDFIAFKTLWREAVEEARATIEILPPETVGMAVLDAHGTPFLGDLSHLQASLSRNELRFHSGHIGGAWPQFKDA